MCALEQYKVGLSADAPRWILYEFFLGSPLILVKKVPPSELRPEIHLIINSHIYIYICRERERESFMGMLRSYPFMAAVYPPNSECLRGSNNVSIPG